MKDWWLFVCMIVSLRRLRPMWSFVLFCGFSAIPCIGCDDAADTIPFPGADGNEDNRPPSLSSLLTGTSGYREGVDESEITRAEPDGCTDAALHLADDCGYTFKIDISKVRCANSYEVCEAYCVSQTDCGVYKIFGRTSADDIAERNYNTCRTACYAQGSATCQEAEQRLRCCDSSENKTNAVNLVAQFNSDIYCNALETCEANCIMMAPSCDTLLHPRPKTSYYTCYSRCQEAILEAKPLTYSPESYCDQFPQDPHCVTPAPPSPYVTSNLCIDFPKSPDCPGTTSDTDLTYCKSDAGKNDTRCVDAKTYCTTNSSNDRCTGENNYCISNAEDILCITSKKYCVSNAGQNDARCIKTAAYCENNTTDIHCRKAYTDESCPPIDEEPGLCTNACSTADASCVACLCDAIPALCANNGSTSTGNVCTYYPYSRECSEDKWCTYHPGESGCPK